MIPPMNTTERKDRRKKMSDEIVAGKRKEQVAAKYGVSVQTVINSCREHGVSFVRKAVKSGVSK